jgi:predicted Fe-Mo cluster-binding NifX family protein
MLIAITSTGQTEESPIDKRFGRARFFLIYDSEKNEFSPLDNESGMNEMQGAGVSSGEKMFKAGVEAVVTGHVGPKAYRTLNASKIKVALCREEVTVKEAAAMYVDGKLTVSNGPDVEGHW